MELMISIEKFNFVKKRLEDAQKLCAECMRALNLAKEYYIQNGYEFKISLDFGKIIYDYKKEALDKADKVKAALKEKLLHNQSENNIKRSINILQTLKVGNNQMFVEDLEKIVDMAQKQDYIQKFGSKLVLDYYLNFVVDQLNSSKLDVTLYDLLYNLCLNYVQDNDKEL